MDGLWLIALAAFLGGGLSALLGWIDSKEPFDGRKFGRSIIFALIAGAGFAFTFNLIGEVTSRDILLAFLSGAGWDGLTNRVLGAIRK